MVRHTFAAAVNVPVPAFSDPPAPARADAAVLQHSAFRQPAQLLAQTRRRSPTRPAFLSSPAVAALMGSAIVFPAP